MNKDSRYIDDYLQTFGIGVDHRYEVEDRWANYEQLATAIEARFAAWNSAGRPEHIT